MSKLNRETGLFELRCGSCGVVRRFKSIASYRTTLSTSKHKDKLCKSCASKLRWKDPNYGQKIFTPEYREAMSRRVTGEGNPFFGRNHSSETISRLKESGKATVGLRKETRGNYAIWLEKYGSEEADRRDATYRKKQSLRSSGTNNPMYGKPAPMGSGNGWSGWYKEWFFRSLRELTYMVHVIEKGQLKWTSAESKELRIPYIWRGLERSYFADFLIDERCIIECKPLKLHDTPLVKAKQDAAIEYCSTNGMTYELVDPGKMEFEEIRELYESGTLRFTDRYLKKFREWESTHEN